MLIMWMFLCLIVLLSSQCLFSFIIFQFPVKLDCFPTVLQGHWCVLLCPLLFLASSVFFISFFKFYEYLFFFFSISLLMASLKYFPFSSLLNIFTTVIVNSLAHLRLMSISFSLLAMILFCSLIWNMFICLFILTAWDEMSLGSSLLLCHLSWKFA